MTQVIEFPEIKKLKTKIKELRQQLSDVVSERDELKYTICENIKTQYMLEFGSLEYQVYEAYCRYLRLRRKKELIQALKNRQEYVRIEDIEEQLDEEFVEYKQKLDDKINEMNRALERNSLKDLSEEDSAELKKMYRCLVMKLHPDVNPEITPAEQELFFHAIEAYRCGDLAAMQLIYAMKGDEEEEDFPAKSLKAIQVERSRLFGLVERVEKEISIIKKGPPYTWKCYLKDAKAKAEKRASLEQELRNYRFAIETLEHDIKTLSGVKDE